MLIILIGAFIINMQHYAGADEEVILEGRLPVYVPMLFAFVVSWFQAGYILVIKTIAQRVNISDFTFFSYLVSSSFYLITALIYWNTHEGSFSPYFLKIGVFGSII
jgi:ammonia channel protein AmtB